jgi:hypothetical protein
MDKIASFVKGIQEYFDCIHKPKIKAIFTGIWHRDALVYLQLVLLYNDLKLIIVAIALVT